MRVFSIFVLSSLLAACGGGDGENEVVVYTSVDQHYAEPILAQFEKRTNIRVRALYDVEASKTTGLVNRLLAERKRPKADVFWNGEFSQTLLLASKGVLARYHPATGYRPLWQDPEGRWTAFGGRARVFIINRERMPATERPVSIFDLVNERWPSSKVGIALPLFGTAATHAAALWGHLGGEKTAEFFRRAQTRGVAFLDGNSVVRDKVAIGELWFGLTDSDDACAAAAGGAPVEIRFPDQFEGGMGTQVIPNTVALVAGSPNPDNGKWLIDYLLSGEVKERLSHLGWFHVADGGVRHDTGCPLPDTIRLLQADPVDTFRNLRPSRDFLRELLLK